MSKFNLGRVTKLIFSGVVAAALTVLIGWYTLELAQDFGLNNPAFWAWAWFAWMGWLVVVEVILPAGFLGLSRKQVAMALDGAEIQGVCYE